MFRIAIPVFGLRDALLRLTVLLIRSGHFHCFRGPGSAEDVV